MLHLKVCILLVNLLLSLNSKTISNVSNEIINVYLTILRPNYEGKSKPSNRNT